MGPKEKELKQVIESLGAAEQKHTNDNFSGKLSDWARLIDRVDELKPTVDSVITQNTVDKANQAKAQFDEILNHLKGLDFNTNSQTIPHIQSLIENFRAQGHAEELLSVIQKAKALSEDTDNAEQMKKLITKAAAERKRFEKSIAETTTEVEKGATRTLAIHFQNRIDELESTDSTNPVKLLTQRNKWLIALTLIAFALVILYVLFANQGWLEGYELSVLFAKAAVVFIISSQVYFKQRNFNIYSDLIARYKHMYVIASTITDYLGVDSDAELKTKLINTGVDTMFSSVETGHLKHSDFHNREHISNVIENIPSPRL